MTPLSRDEMRARLAQEVEGWRPEAGDEVFGTVVSVDTREGDYGPYPYIEIDDEDLGKVVGVHGFHSVLKREIANKTPKRGDTMGVKYLGKKTSKSGTEFEHYNVNIYPADESTTVAPDWDSMAADADVEATEAGINSVENAFPGASEEEPF